MKNPAKKLLLAVLCLGTSWSLLAQTTIKGIVTDESGEPLIGAGVVVEGTTTGTITGIDGDYTLSVPSDAVNLVFSFIGLADQTVPIEGRSQIDVVLKADNTFLDEVVVVGYATVKRRDLLGSVASVGSEKLAEQPVTTVSQALSGKMAGVSVVTTEGDPDADIKIRVRGGGSITQDSSPLYIVDGFPVESINDISSSEIATIDVLKDAFSTAIYGSRGANGVVIVTTKNAEKGQKISVKLNTYWGLKTMANKNAIQVMDPENFVKFQWELATIRDNVSSNYTPYFGSFNDIDLYSGIAGNDWIKAVFGNTGSSFSADASISGSGENYNWTLSYAHLGDNAIMKGSSYKRDNLSFKSKFNTSKTTSVDVNIRYSRTNVLGSGANGINDTGTTSGNGRLKHSVSYSPIPLVANVVGADEEQDFGDNAPPLRSVADNDSKRIRNDWNANAAFNWTIIDNLNLKIEGGLENFTQTDDRFYGLTTYYVANNSTVKGTPSNQHKELFRNKYRNTNTLNYDFKDLLGNDDHSLTALVGEEMTISKSNLITLMIDGFPDFFDSNMAWSKMSSGLPSSSVNTLNPDDNLLSFFTRVNYDYKHRYSVGATFRADGSSKFAKGNQWGFFPSAALSWTISNEDFMAPTKDWLDQLKLRYSFGTAGNNNIPSGLIALQYASITTTWLSQSSNYYAPVKFDGKMVMPNDKLKWETTYTHNIGLDFSVLKGKLNGSLELYQNDIKDLLINFPIPGSGYDTQFRNLGSTRNRGIELTLNAPIIQKKDFSLNMSGNIAYNKNVVTDLGGLPQITAQSYWASTEIGDDYIVQKDQPLGNMYGYVHDGFYTADDFNYTDGKWVLKPGIDDCSDIVGSSYMMPGAPRFKVLTTGSPVYLDKDGKNTTDPSKAVAKDEEGNPIVDHYKLTNNDRTIIGNASPDFTGGFALSGYFKGIDFSANFNFMIGNQVYNANKIEFSSSRKFYNRNLSKEMEVSNRWSNIDWDPESATYGELITDPEKLKAANADKTMWSPAVQNAIFSDWAVENASFLRLQSATIGYTLPEELTQKVHLRKVRVYVTGTNLFCLTPYSGYDPEVDTRRATPLTPGVDYSAYPKSIGFVAGLNLTF